MTSSMNAVVAASSISWLTPSSSRAQRSSVCLPKLCRRDRILGITRVSSPQRMSGWASSMTRINVVPDRGTPPTNTIGVLWLYRYCVWFKFRTSIDTTWVLGSSPWHASTRYSVLVRVHVPNTVSRSTTARLTENRITLRHCQRNNVKFKHRIEFTSSIGYFCK